MTGKLHESLTEESLCRFTFTGDSLKLFDFYRHYREADQKIDDPLTTYFQKTGINGIKANFAVYIWTAKRCYCNQIMQNYLLENSKMEHK